MSNVSLSIGGRDYTVACDTGEEAHVSELGRMINAKLETLPPGTANNEARSLLFAALLLADEVFELRKAGADPLHPMVSAGNEAVPSERLVSLATRLEALADLLEMPASTGGDQHASA